MYGDEKRRDVLLLLAATVPQERIAELTGVSVRTIRRIAREPVGPAAPRPGGLDRGQTCQMNRSEPMEEQTSRMRETEFDTFVESMVRPRICVQGSASREGAGLHKCTRPLSGILGFRATMGSARPSPHKYCDLQGPFHSAGFQNAG